MDPGKSGIPELAEFFSSLLDNAAFGIIALDIKGKVTLTNPMAINLLDINLTPEGLRGENILDSIEHFSLLKDFIKKALQKGKKTFELEAELFNDKYLNIKGRAISNGYIIYINDVTQLKETEANSIFSIIAGQENERRRLAREIHDGIGPLLSSVKLELDSFLDDHTAHDSDPSFEKLINIRETIDSITNDLRNLSHHLLPRLLDEFGLYSAFNSLITRISASTKTNLEFYCNFDSETRFDKEIELNLYRCGQELVNNAVKYAKASEILVQLILHDQTIVLMVEDDGIGFEPEKSDQDPFGIGLTNVETRVRALDGVFTLDSVIDKGTTASIEIPLWETRN